MHPPPSSKREGGAPRRLALLGAVALVVGNMIGSGVFMLPSNLQPMGWGAVMGWLLTIIGSLFVAGTLSALARRMPHGGPYHYIEAGLGGLPAFVAAFVYWMSVWMTNTAIALEAVVYLGQIFPILGTSVAYGGLAAIMLIWLFTLPAYFGVQSAGRVQILTVVVKALLLLGIILVAALALGRGHFPLPPFSFSTLHFTAITGADGVAHPGITAAMTLTLWAMVGFESATIPAGKVENPARNIPRATLLGTLATGILYLFACSAISLSLSAQDAHSGHATFSLFANNYLGAGWGQGVALLVLIGAVGGLNGWIFLAGEIPFTLARQGVFPRWFGAINRFGAPHNALLLSSCFASGLVVVNMLGQHNASLNLFYTITLLIATVQTLTLFLLCALAAWRLGVSRWLLVPALGYIGWTYYGASANSIATGDWSSDPNLWSLVALGMALTLWAWQKRRNAAA
jgi:basic amino acid/polyamine antiporter, APA family